MHTITENKLSVHNLLYLPAYAQYLLEQHLPALVKVQYKLAGELHLPLLHTFQHLSPQDITSFITQQTTELLDCLVQNKVQAYIEHTRSRLLNLVAPTVNKVILATEDIPLIYYIRKRSLVHFLPQYVKTTEQMALLTNEIDIVLMRLETASSQNYMQLLQQRAEEQSHLAGRITNTSPGIIYLFNLETYSIDFINERAEAFFDLTIEAFRELGNKALSLLIHPDDLRPTFDAINDLATTAKDGEVRTIEYRLKNKRGEYVWMRNYMSIFRRDEKGNATAAIGNILNINKEKQTEEQLLEAQELYKQAQALSHIGHFTLNLKTNQITFTEELNRIYGFDPQTPPMDYSGITALRDPEDFSDVRQKIKHTIRTGEPFNFYYKIITPDGVKKTLHALGRTILNEAGEPTQLVGTVQDVTDRQKMVHQLQKSESLYKQAEILANMGNWSWDVRTDQLKWSDQLYKIYGLEPQSEEITIDRFLSFIHPDDRPAIEAEVKAGYPNDYTEMMFRIISDDKVEKTLRSISQVQRDVNGKVIGVIGSEQDVTEHQHLVSQLKQSESLYMQAQSLAHVGNWSWHIAKDKILWSDELYRIYGLAPAQKSISYAEYFSFIHPDDRKALTNNVQKAVKEGRSWQQTHRIIWHDGSVHYLYATGEAVKNEQGKIYMLIGTAQDITRQKEYEKQLGEQQNFIQKIADAAPSIIAAYNIRSGKYIFINEGIRKLLGYDPRYALEQGIEFLVQLVHPDDLPRLMAQNEQALDEYNQQQFQGRNDMMIDFSYRLKHANGEWRWFHTYSTIFDRNDQGHIEHVLNISLDITDRKEAESKLAEQEHFIKHIADASPTILYVFDVATDSIVYINREIFFVLGYTTDDILAMGAAVNETLYHPDDLHLLPERKGNDKRFQQIGSMIQYECRMKHKDDYWCWLLVREIAFKVDDNGQVQQILGAALDISQRKEMERSLLYNSFQLEQSNASLEEFAYVASHDLKEPLRKISTFGDRLLATQAEHLTGDGKIYLKKIVDASQRMQTMISDLLSISMISGNRSFEPYSLQKILDDVLQTLEYKIEQKNAVVTSDPLPEANIIPSQFRQLFQNLLSNSLKFTRNNVQPVIHITHQFVKPEELADVQISKAKQYHRLQFADNGIGFENEFAGKIFAIFQRLHGRSEYEGTGIGLAICKKIVEHHGGVIYATGVPDEGATFTIVLPASE